MTLQIDDDGIGGATIRRTLHFFWLVDESGSMSGQKIQAVNHAIKEVLPEIQRIEDEQRVSILVRAIKFGDCASWHVGPTPVPVKDFTWKDMDANGRSTSTAQAVELLNQELALEKIGRRNVPPVIILLSDGHSTDPQERFDQAIATLDSMPWGSKAVRVSIGIGGSEDDYDKNTLDRFISPYLRNEAKLETLPATSVRRLVEYIKVVSTQAANAAASTKSDLKNSHQTPVQFDPNALQNSNAPSANQYGNLDPNAVF